MGIERQGGTVRGLGATPSDTDPDLVAYWKFDEGEGYVVKDATGRGHDLQMSTTPRYEVVRWVAACGNGIVEGDEECDTGDANGGNGCSAICKVRF